MDFPDILERFLAYVKIDTQSDPDSDSFPSSKKQFDLAKVLKEELEALNLEEVELNQWGYVTATLSTNQSKSMPTIALIAHMDTSPDASGKDVKPIMHENYDLTRLDILRHSGWGSFITAPSGREHGDGLGE